MIVFAFPTLGKSCYCQKYQDGYDYDFGSFKRRCSFPNSQYLRMAWKLSENVKFVFVNSILGDLKDGEGKAIVLVPDYGTEEARRRLLSRGDNPLDWSDFLDFYADLKGKWVEFALAHNLRVIHCHTVEEGMLRLKQSHVV